MKTKDAGPALPSRTKLVLYLTKSERITFAATVSEKASIFASAKRYHLTVTEYLMRLHQLAEQIAGSEPATRRRRTR